MLKFNSFRAKRYLRSKFVEGKFLLASEASDLELEIIDLLRQNIKNEVGNVAIEDGWKVERLSASSILIKPGEAWFDGLPFNFRNGKDQLVIGLGTVPAGTSLASDPNGLGKVITFNDGATTPTNNYRIIVTAKEEVITSNEDRFLQNLNLTESTAQKIRLTYSINIIPDSFIEESPIPYRGESFTNTTVTNFPGLTDLQKPNFINKVIINPISSGNGEFIESRVLAGSEKIDGRDIDIVIRNDENLIPGSNNLVLPTSPSERSFFSHGKLIDSKGTEFHVIEIFPDTVTSQTVIRIDKEADQPNPEIVNGEPYTLYKRNVYVTDDVNGNPLGNLHWPIATVNWNQSTQITHESKVVDLRNSVKPNLDYQQLINAKFDLTLTKGGTLSYGVTDSSILSWGDDLELINPSGVIQTIAANDVTIPEGGSVVYELDVINGGALARGNMAVTTASGGTLLTLSGMPDLTDVRVGNVFRIANEIAIITNINNVSKNITVDTSISNIGAATIYKDVFGATLAPASHNNFVLAVRNDNKVYMDGGLELQSGEETELGDGITVALLGFIGSTGETDDSPNYASDVVITQGASLVATIGELDAQVASILSTLSTPIYDERVLYPAGLAAFTVITIPTNSRNAGIQEKYNVGSGELEIYVNQLFKFQGADWNSVDDENISFNFDLPNDAEVHFRKDSLGGSSGGGGGGTGNSWSDPVNSHIVPLANNVYDLGSSTNKFRDGYFSGKLTVDGLIDPTGIELVKQTVNPFSTGQAGIWLNDDEELIIERPNETTQNLSKKVEDLEDGVGINAFTRVLANNTGSTIPKGTPVYAPTAGNIAPADATNNNYARVIGITSEEILNGDTGKVAYGGFIENLILGLGLAHGDYLYLGLTPGSLTDQEPSLGVFPSGFNVIRIGIAEGDNLYLQIEHVGVL